MRVLVIADETATTSELHDAVALHCGPTDEVFVIGPHRDRAKIAACLSGLAQRGVVAWGRTGPSDPVVALADALRDFTADTILVAGDAVSEARRLGAGLARRATMEFGLPVVLVRIGVEQPMAPAAA